LTRQGKLISQHVNIVSECTINSDARHASHLYITDFKAWDNIYQRRVSSLAKKEEKRLAIKRPAEVKLQFVSPVEETIDRAESEIRASVETFRGRNLGLNLKAANMGKKRRN
jgi:hypothetical protein